MPIVGLTDMIVGVWNEIGRLHKGGPRGAGKGGAGIDLDHFRFTSPDPMIEAMFKEVYGSQPKSLRVVMPYATADECFKTSQEKWGAGGLYHICDGVTMTRWRGQDGKIHIDPRPCVGGCKPYGRLSVFLPELMRAADRVGVATLVTTSVNDIVQITETLKIAEDKVRKAGRSEGLEGMWFMLRRVPTNISAPDWKDPTSRRNVKTWLVEIAPMTHWMETQYQALPEGDHPTEQQSAVQSGEQEGEIIEGEVIDPIILKKASPTWLARYQQLIDRAIPQGIEYVVVDESISEAELTMLGKDLLYRIELAESLKF